MTKRKCFTRVEVQLRPRNPTMDALVKQVSRSETYSFDNVCKLVERARNARTSLGESLHFGLCEELANCVEKLEAENYELVQQLAAKQAKIDLATSTAEKVIKLDYAGSVWMLDLPKIVQNLIEKLKEKTDDQA